MSVSRARFLKHRVGNDDAQTLFAKMENFMTTLSMPGQVCTPAFTSRLEDLGIGVLICYTRRCWNPPPPTPLALTLTACSHIIVNSETMRG